MRVEDAAQMRAERLLAEHWDKKFPVDPISIARSLGLEVKGARFKDPDTSGAIIAKGRDDVTVYFADSDPYARQLFTVAHELGHFSERAAAQDDDYSFVERRHPESYDLHEFYADEFAGNLLMPAGVFRDLWDAGRSVNELAAYFGVSPAAVRMRLKRLQRMGQMA